MSDKFRCNGEGERRIKQGKGFLYSSIQCYREVWLLNFPAGILFKNDSEYELEPTLSQKFQCAEICFEIDIFIIYLPGTL